MTATTLPNELDDGRETFLAITGLTGGNVGALPDADHKESGGYHCGCQDIINIGKWATAGSSLADYSVRQTRDRVGGNACSAIDVGDDWPNGGRPAWLRFNNWLVELLIAGDPELAALRAVNFSPDGTLQRRYDTNNRNQGIIASTDTVRWHTHLEWWRNTAGTLLRKRSIDRIALVMRAAIANDKGMLSMTASEWHTGEADGPFLTQGTPGYAGQQRDTAAAFTWKGVVDLVGMVSEVRAGVNALTAASGDIDDDDMAQVRAEARAGALEGVQAGIDDIVAGVIAALPEPEVPGDNPAYTLAQLEDAVRSALGQAELTVTFDSEA